MRIALGIEYNGAAFTGWQTQQGQYTIQSEVERALSRVADHPVAIVCAGRTDKGVHAVGQVIHFDSDAPRNEHAWVFGGNANLPKDVSVTWARAMPEDFHARFSARRRRYRYVIFNRRVRPSFLGGRVSWEHRLLDVATMQSAAATFLGEHDFSAFRASECQSKSTLREVFSLDVQRKGELVLIDIEANAFLHHMVRNISGVLMDIGAGEQPPEWAGEVLASRDRRQASATAPPHGLYLVNVTYPAEFDLPKTDPGFTIW